MSHPNNITTTAGEVFTYAESAEMARMIHKRFGYDLSASTAAWNRLLGVNISTYRFKKLLDFDPAHP